LIPAILQRAASQFADRPALLEEGRTIHYAELADRVARMAAVLLQKGLQPGERIAVLAPNSPHYLELYFATAHAGLVLVPLNVRAHPEGLARVLSHSQASLVVYHRALQQTAQELLARSATDFIDFDQLEKLLAESDPCAVTERNLSDPAQLYFTSGTTGEPKGVILTHRNVTSHALMAVAALQLSDRDCFGHIAPMFHLADAWATFAVTAVGGAHRMVAEFNAANVLRELHGGITLTNLVPTMLADLVHHPSQPPPPDSSLRLILSGGAPIAPALVGRIVEKFGCDYVQTYGLTETSPFLTLSTLPPKLQALPLQEKLRYLAKTGRPLAGVDVKVVRDSGEPIANNGREVGEIWARGDSVTPGYWRNDAATKAAFEGGWLRTGDLATRDAEGFINIVDRKKDVILSGGETIYSTEVEAVLHEHSAVHIAAVFGLPHPRWGEAVVAAVVLVEASEASEQVLLDHCRERLGGYQVPKRVLICDALPRTGSGKLQKRTLRQHFAELFSKE
jgi:acyl-CoA synthetase (AMP-forming)/AMP-acid ligase II